MDAKHKGSKAKLERRNAIKNIDYDASSSSSTSFDEQSPKLRTRSLDLSPLSDNKTSFRIKGIVEFDRFCRTLGFNGPEDFAIPTAVWEAQKSRCSSDISAKLLKDINSPKVDLDQFADKVRVTSEFSKEFERSKLNNDFGNTVRVCDKVCVGPSNGDDTEVSKLKNGLIGVGPSKGGGGGGIKGERPPVLAPPPVKLPPVVDNVSSTWDILKSFAPQEDEEDLVSPVQVGFIGELEEEDRVIKENEEVNEEVLNGVRLGETDYVSQTYTSISDDDDDDDDDDGDDGGDDVFDVIMEPVYSISPNGKFRLTISSWQKGELLGSGSFGTVYEGFNEDGFFFAVKEVSLLDQGSQGKQSILQLEQEISLLSQFEHENIVRYLGTDKDDAKLYIFLELVTKGSLASLYQKYNLRDSQVSAYTRQILSGLKYLHDRNVVHRDIKCANILVDVSGSVKLADFGLAKATNMNDVKSCKGTAFWMAPEVVNLRNRGYGLAADIWSLGCTVLEMLTRRPPYSHLEGMQALFRIGRGEPPSIPNSLSSDARDFILQCIQVNPNDRPTAAQLEEHPFVKRPLSTPSSLPSPRYHSVRS